MKTIFEQITVLINLLEKKQNENKAKMTPIVNGYNEIVGYEDPLDLEDENDEINELISNLEDWKWAQEAKLTA